MAIEEKVGVHTEAPLRLEGKYKGMLFCWILGLGTILTWNSLVTVEDYYYGLFPKYHPSRAITLSYMPFAVVTMAILACYESKLNTRKRNLSGFAVFFSSSVLLIVLDLATSGKGGAGPFIGICAIAASFGVADALVQGGMVGDLSLMCPEFLQSYLAGIAASGVLTSTLRLVTKAAFESFGDGLRKGASSSEGSTTVSADLAAGGIQTTQEDKDGAEHCERLTKKQLFIQNIDYAIDVALIFVLSLSIFPGFLYENTGSHQLGSWYALVLITVYNMCDLISRYIPLVETLKIKSRKGLTIAVLSRYLFIPAFYFAAKYGDQGWMILLTSFLGLTTGYLTVCVMTEAPKGYKGPEQNALGNLLVLCVLVGVFAGVALDWLWLVGKRNAF